MKENKKRTQVHMLPAENGVIFKNRTTGTLVMKISNVAKKLYPAQHLYFTADEEIKEGDWAYNPDNSMVFQPKDLAVNLVELRKITASTDPKLTKKKCTNCSGKGHIDRDGFRDCHCKTGEVYNIAQPSQELIKAYCEQGGFDEVDVEYLIDTYRDGTHAGHPNGKWILKLNPDNTVITHLIEEKMYSREEVKNLIGQHSNFIDSNIDYDSIHDSCCGVSSPEWDDEKFLKENL